MYFPEMTTILCLLLGLLSFCSVTKAWLPGVTNIRGVNLGGLFIVEPWMMYAEWSSMGCGGFNDEFQCVQALGQSAADAAFEKHWSSWITQDDINQIKSAGLNTVRVPLGFWIHESLVQPGEYFPRGGFAYLERLCKMAATAGLYIILDLHAAPGGQSPDQQFTGQSVNPVGFFKTANYERAYEWLSWITSAVHTRSAFRNVGAIQLVNEPVPANDEEKHSLLYEYYPTAWKRIRAVEDSLGVSKSDRLHIQMMDSRWWLGSRGQDPNQGLGGIDLSFALYDNHNYRAFDCAPDSNDCDVPATRSHYLAHSCNENLSGQKPVIVGEWSLGTSHPDGDQFNINSPDAVSFYRRWFGAQIHSYEKQFGWLFWTWKAHLNDYRWSYQDAIQAGVIPRSDPTEANDPDVCASLK